MPETEDVVHQAFLLAFDRLANGREFSGDPHMWLRGTVRNLVHVLWRERRKAPGPLADRILEVADESEDAVGVTARASSGQALSRCLEKLSVEERHLVSNRYDKGLAIIDMAAALSLNVATLRVRLFRIRDALRRCVERQLEGGAA